MASTPQTPLAEEFKRARIVRRSPLASYMTKAAARTKYHYLLGAFLPSAFVEWITEYLKHRIGSRHAFQYYDGSSNDNGIYKLGDESVIGGRPDPKGEIRVSVAGDWGTGTAESASVAKGMIDFLPHFTIHLGDVYYVGDETEVKENCLGIPDPNRKFTPCRWPLGSVGSFALNGNHEMYALGNAYFDLFLPRLGMRPAPAQEPRGQKASFFCLENEQWRIIALDTGYNSVGIPLLEYLFRPDCKLRDELLDWLRRQVNPKGDQRGIVLLSHHQYYSSFDAWYTKPAEQLAELIDRPVLWFWGHEHRMAVYPKFRNEGAIEAYGRCIGHGGMPVEIKEAPQDKRCPPPLVYDARRNPKEKDELGYNGFVNFTFQGNQLLVDYRDLKNHQLLIEKWAVENGNLVGKEFRIGVPDPGQDFKRQANLTAAFR